MAEQQAQDEQTQDQAGEELSALDQAIGVYEQLREKAEAARGEVEELETERRGLVLRAETGDEQARKRLQSIDRKLPSLRQRVADLDAAIEQQADEVAAAERAETRDAHRQRMADLRQTAEEREAEIAKAEDYLRRAGMALANADEHADKLRRAAPRWLIRDGADPLSRDRIGNRLQDVVAALIPGAGLDRTRRPISGDPPAPDLVENEQRAHAELLSEIEAAEGGDR